MNVVPHDRDVTQVDIAYHGLTYNLWVHGGSVVVMIGCHVVRMTPDEAEEAGRVFLHLADQARS